VAETTVEGFGATFNRVICKRYSPTDGYHGGSDSSNEDVARINYKPVDKGFFTVHERVITPSMDYDLE
jgi:hypothetical protein